MHPDRTCHETAADTVILEECFVCGRFTSPFQARR